MQTQDMEVLPQVDYNMRQSEFFIITSSMDGVTWNDDEVAEKSPINRVRELLGGRWERSSEYGTYIKAFFNGKKRVLVLGYPPGTAREFVMAEMEKIRLGREDRH